MDEGQTIKELRGRVAQLEALLEKRTKELTQELSAYVTIKANLDQRTFELNQRIRELKAVIQISTLSDLQNLSLADFYDYVLKAIVSSFQYPEDACAELRVGDQVYRTDNYRETGWKLGRGLMDQGEMTGYLTVYYLRERPESDFGPFTKEEKNLLIVITRYLGQIIKRKIFEEQNRLFHSLFEQSISAVVLFSDERKPLYINHAFTGCLGYSLEDLEVGLDAFLKQVIFDDNGFQLREDIVEGLKKLKQAKGEVRARKKDGGEAWIRFVVFYITISGKDKYIAVIFNDISVEKQLESLRFREQKKYIELVENLPLEVALFDREGNFIFVNENTEKVFKRSRGELGGKNIREFLDKETADAMVGAIETVFQTKKPNNIDRVINQEGKKRYFKVARIPIFNEAGAVVNVLVIAEDVTKQKQQENQIQILHQIDSLSNITSSVEDSLKLAFHYLNQIEWYDGGGVYLFDEERVRLTLTYSAGLSDEFINSVRTYSSQHSQVQTLLRTIPVYLSVRDHIGDTRQAMEREGITFVAAIPMIYRDEVIGSINLASRKTEAISTNDKLIIESIASRLANLITLVKTREKLVLSNQELNNMLKTISEKQQLLIQKSKLESLGELSAGLAHEINQPISVISLITENIQFKMKEGNLDRDYLQRKIDAVNQHIRKIRDLIDHVRIFSRDQGTLMFERVDVNRVILNTLSLVDAQLRYHRIKVNLDLQENPGYTLGNPSRLEQVFFNLISNARDALDENEALVLMEVPVKEISIRVKAIKHQFEIKIRDNGTGIKPEHLDHIFDPFFTTKTEGKGTGLGLSIVYGIISEMKGEIKIDSVVNQYTEATIHLPRYFQRQ